MRLGAPLLWAWLRKSACVAHLIHVSQRIPSKPCNGAAEGGANQLGAVIARGKWGSRRLVVMAPDMTTDGLRPGLRSCALQLCDGWCRGRMPVQRGP